MFSFEKKAGANHIFCKIRSRIDYEKTLVLTFSRFQV